MRGGASRAGGEHPVPGVLVAHEVHDLLAHDGPLAARHDLVQAVEEDHTAASSEEHLKQAAAYLGACSSEFLGTVIQAPLRVALAMVL